MNYREGEPHDASYHRWQSNSEALTGRARQLFQGIFFLHH
jgi:hypothetical protein